jgi:hypothetical protein
MTNSWLVAEIKRKRHSGRVDGKSARPRVGRYYCEYHYNHDNCKEPARCRRHQLHQQLCGYIRADIDTDALAWVRLCLVNLEERLVRLRRVG